MRLEAFLGYVSLLGKDGSELAGLEFMINAAKT